MENSRAVMAKLAKVKACENLEYLQTGQVFGQYHEGVSSYIHTQHLYFCELIECLENRSSEWWSQELKEIHRFISVNPDGVDEEAFYRIPGIQSTRSLCQAYSDAVENPIRNITEYELRVLDNIELSIKKRERLEAQQNNIFPHLTRLYQHYLPSSGCQNDYSLSFCQNLLLDGGCYDGQVNSRNERHGEGVFRTTLGQRYEGDWKQDMRHGYGKQVYEDGGWYEGSWKENQKHGFGKRVWTNGLSYVGEWDSNKCVSPRNPMNYSFMKVFSCGYFLLLLILVSILYFQLKPPVLGDLTYTRLEDGYFSGNLSEDNRTGLGIFIWDSGDVYDGHWKNNLMDGTGIYIQRSGNISSGQFLRGEFKSGLVKFVYNNGDTYYGDVLSGQYHGQGTYLKSNSDIYRGDWDSNSMTGAFLTSNKSIYIGNFSNNFPQSGEMFIPLENEGFYIGSFQSGERSGTGLLRASNGALHYGDWLNGQCMGSGYDLHRNGTIAYGQYQGRQLLKGKIIVPVSDSEWLFASVLTDRIDGLATFISEDASMYVGNWLDNNKHGAGVFFSHNGSCSIGVFQQNMFYRGKVLQLDESGSWYYGEVQAGRRSGFGTMKNSDGSVYSGKWKADTKRGEGLLIQETGDFRIGLFKNGELTTGTGLIRSETGNIYFGNITNGLFNGLGTYIWYNSSSQSYSTVYLGEWLNGQRYGNGLFVKPISNVLRGSFENGVFATGSGLLEYDSGDVYYGAFLHSLYHGRGVYIWQNGTMYSGNWEGGKITGYGLKVDSDGSVFLGQFEDNKFRNGSLLDSLAGNLLAPVLQVFLLIIATH